MVANLDAMGKTKPFPLALAHLATAITFAVSALFYIASSWHWRIMVDSAVMHYVVFMLQHGRAPYTQISDNNMPGAYFAEWLGMRLFGPSDLGWRFFEFTVLGVLTAALADIAKRWDRMAGIFAGLLFLVIHAVEGPQYAGERELLIATLIAIALAVLFRAVETDRPWLMVFFGLATGLASSIKPTYLPFGFVLLPLGCAVLYRKKGRYLTALLSGLGAMLFVFALDVGFLVHFHAVEAFRFIFQQVIPAYVGLLTHVPWLVKNTLPRLVLPLLLAWPVLIFLNVRNEGRWTWQKWMILLCATFGLISYYAQHKGFLHHRYVLEIFFFLLVGIEIFRALRRPGLSQLVAAVSLLFVLFYAVPKLLKTTRKLASHTDLELAMQGDLQHLGTPQQLENKVQCFDLVYGCLDALYHLRVLENASFTGDLLFFVPKPNKATDYYREQFWRGITVEAPDVVVLSNQNLGEPNDFNRIQNWPNFQSWLTKNYAPVVERHFTNEHFGAHFEGLVAPVDEDAYRIYLRKGTPLQEHAGDLAAERYPGQF